MRKMLVHSVVGAAIATGMMTGTAHATASPSPSPEPVFTQPGTGSSAALAQLMCGISTMSSSPTFPSYPCWYNPIPS